MSTKTPTREEAVTERDERRPVWLLILVLVVAVVAIVAVFAWQLSGDGESTADAVPAEVEEEIIALIDAWYTAWNESDGQAAVALFAEDGRYVNWNYSAPGQQPLEGLSGSALKAEVDGAAAFSINWNQDPLIIVRDNTLLGRPDSYRVATRVRSYDYGDERIGLYNIVVDDDGTLKFRYVEAWSELGWHRLAEGQPWRGSEGGE